MAISGAWTVEEKRSIIAEYESAPKGEKWKVLEAHGVSPDQLRGWRGARDAGVLEVGWSVRRPRMTPRVESAEIARLRAENDRLARDLERARKDVDDRQAALESLGKATALLHELVSVKSAKDGSPPGPSPT
jgi:transposase-like protein